MPITERHADYTGPFAFAWELRTGDPEQFIRVWLLQMTDPVQGAKHIVLSLVRRGRDYALLIEGLDSEFDEDVGLRSVLSIRRSLHPNVEVRFHAKGAGSATQASRQLVMFATNGMLEPSEQRGSEWLSWATTLSSRDI
jgi:hypothetical protein